VSGQAFCNCDDPNAPGGTVESCPVHDFQPMHKRDLAFQDYLRTRTTQHTAISDQIEAFGHSSYVHGMAQGRTEVRLLMSELAGLVQTVPCELCRLKGGANITEDGGCRHRGFSMTVPEIVARAVYVVKKERAQ